MSVLRVKNGDQWDIVPAIKGDTGDPAEPGSITDAMLVPDGIKAQVGQLWGNQLKGELSGDLLTASDAYAAPPMALTVDGRSTQDGTPTPDAPVPIVSVDSVELHASADGTTDYGSWPVTLDLDGHVLRSLPNGTKDTLALTYLRPSTREGWAWYSRELVQRVGSIDLGDQTWTTSGTGTAQKYAAIISPPMPYGWLAAAAYMCSAYTTVPSRASSTSMPDDSVGNRATRGDVVYVRDTRFVDEPDPTALKAALSGVRFDYALNASYIQTHTLDPIELPVLPAPTCTVWADPTTGLAMGYVRDTNLAFAQLEAALADLATS